jgi:hypothetical protein
MLHITKENLINLESFIINICLISYLVDIISNALQNTFTAAQFFFRFWYSTKSELPYTSASV